MEQLYTIVLTKTDYDRILKMIENDEKNRVKGRERMRTKLGGVSFERGPVKKKIQFDLINISMNKIKPQNSDSCESNSNQIEPNIHNSKLMEERNEIQNTLNQLKLKLELIDKLILEDTQDNTSST